MKNIVLLISLIISVNNAVAQHSVARKWNEVLLEAIRNDYARPTVHARNLHHTSILMYDSWAAYTKETDTYFLGKRLNNFNCEYQPIVSDTPEEDIETTLSYAVYRLLSHRFSKSPNASETQSSIDKLFRELGHNKTFISTNYLGGSAAALGNYLGNKMIEYGLQDGANEENEYVNLYYESVNTPLAPAQPGNPYITDVNRWQPLTLELFIDQAGNVIPGNTPEFLSPEWGNVLPFAMGMEDVTIHERDGQDYWVYNDPGAPPYMDLMNGGSQSEEYKWTFELVSIWSSHLDPSDGVMIDISPSSIGNIDVFPSNLEEYHTFYNVLEGGDPGLGHQINPTTNAAYVENIVPRGDYTRVLAEFWADGPNSETPPGHWFTLLNYVNDHPDLVKKLKGEGEILNDLEWDVKSYFVLGGAMHDAAISAWGIKGWYDYIRPISALRAMADRGQSTDNTLSNYSESGINLIEGYIEVVKLGDPLAGLNNENVDKIKLMAWKGPEYINDPTVDEAGVGWILAENWWPYQRPSFVTPPFAGYISGHSTYSRAAAEVLTLLTGDPFFPGGVGEFIAPKNEFLVFEEGPSVDVTLQWATYRDASDQCSLSRIWGGIHPPADDMPGRIIGEKIGKQSFEFAELYFNNRITGVKDAVNSSDLKRIFYLRNNPAKDIMKIDVNRHIEKVELNILTLQGVKIYTNQFYDIQNQLLVEINSIPKGVYILSVDAGIGQLWIDKFIVE